MVETFAQLVELAKRVKPGQAGPLHGWIKPDGTVLISPGEEHDIIALEYTTGSLHKRLQRLFDDEVSGGWGVVEYLVDTKHWVRLMAHFGQLDVIDAGGGMNRRQFGVLQDLITYHPQLSQSNDMVDVSAPKAKRASVKISSIVHMSNKDDLMFESLTQLVELAKRPIASDDPKQMRLRSMRDEMDIVRQMLDYAGFHAYDGGKMEGGNFDIWKMHRGDNPATILLVDPKDDEGLFFSYSPDRPKDVPQQEPITLRNATTDQIQELLIKIKLGIVGEARRPGLEPV